MRIIALAAAALFAGASAAHAAPPVVTVTIGPELQEKTDTYGAREVAYLGEKLRASVERSLGRTGALEDARVELVLLDAKPNRPTFEQLRDTPGLSMQSFGVGGAEIGGRIVTADGAVQPIAYRWYESDIRQAVGLTTWSDAISAFHRVAAQLAKGRELARR
jgi:hypothetical protein